MEHSEKTFQVLEILDREAISTQRQLAEHSGISLGQVNYILKSLLEKGFVKIGNFHKNPRKIGYMYLLTPKGIEIKSRLAVKFVMSKLNEYKILRKGLAERLAEFEKKGQARIIFVGPPLVKEFLESIIKERDMNLLLAGHYDDWKDLKNIAPESFDIALLFDGNSRGIRKICEAVGISREKLISLW